MASAQDQGEASIEQQGCCGEVTVKMPVSGIPEDATPLSEVEKQEILARWYGHWKILGAGLFMFSDVFVM